MKLVKCSGRPANPRNRTNASTPQIRLKIVAIKRLCRAAGVEKVDAGPKGATLAFRNNDFKNPAGLVAFMQKQAGTVQLRPDHRMVYRRPWDKPEQRVVGLTRLMQELVAIAA
jgi:transcription-repair coupling factor (superfamily II helicase)